MTSETATLYDDIRALLDEPSGGEETGFLDRAEHTLTDGYARALALETERVRLQKRMSELAHGLDGERGGAPAEELATVARRLSATGTELRNLRRVLRSLRARTRAFASS
jgi:ABC-type phosphate transport system auxiliary subunit